MTASLPSSGATSRCPRPLTKRVTTVITVSERERQLLEISVKSLSELIALDGHLIEGFWVGDDMIEPPTVDEMNELLQLVR